MKSMSGLPLKIIAGVLLLELFLCPEFHAQDRPPDSRIDLYGDPLPDGALARLGSVRLRQTGRDALHGVSVTCLAFSPDGRRIVSGGGTGTVCVWDVDSGKELHRLKGHEGPVSSVACSPDGTLIASAGGDRMVATRQGVEGDKTVRLWEMASGRELRVLKGHARRVTAVAFSPDGRKLASGSLDETVRIWQVSSGDSLPSLDGYKGGVTSLAFTKDGSAMATVDGSHHLRIVALPTPQDQSTRLERLNIALRGSPGPWPNGDVSAFCLSPDETQAVTVDGPNPIERSVRFWNLANGKELPVRIDWSKERLPICSEAVFSPDGKTLALRGGAGALSLWDPSTGQKRLDLPGHQSDVSAVAFSPDGSVLASGSDDRTVRLWDTATGREIVKTRAHGSWLDSLFFSPDGKSVVTAAGDSTIRFWDRESGKELEVLQQRPFPNRNGRIVRSADGKVFASTGADGSVQIWDYPDRRHRTSLRAIPPEINGIGSVESIALSPDGKLLAESCFGILRLLDVATGKEQRRMEGPMGSATSMVFAANGRVLAAVGPAEGGSNQGLLQLWDALSGRRLASDRFPERFPSALDLSPDGRLLAAVSHDGKIRLWETVSGRPVLSWPGPPKGSRAVAFSPDGKLLATGGNDHVVRLWSVFDGQPLGVLEGHAEFIAAVAFSPEGTALASASGDTTSLLWRVPAVKDSGPGAPMEDKDLEQCWSELAGIADAARAYSAMLRFQKAGDSVLPFLKGRVLESSLPAASLRDLLAGLDHAQAEIREKSMAELIRSGEERAIRSAPLDGLGPEGRERLRILLHDFESPLPKSAGAVRALRTVQILERMGTKEARVLLQEIAGEKPQTRKAREAAAALLRMSP